MKDTLELYRMVRLIRRVEEKIIEIFPSDKIQSPVHLSIGQEAVSVGVLAAAQPTDLCLATYRGHAAYLAKGGTLPEFFAELCGKVTGCCKGKGGSMHLAYPQTGFMGTSAVVGSMAPVAVGLALGSKLLGDSIVTIVFLGDGAFDEGVLHESLNLAVMKQVPVLFVCENNELAVHSRREARQAFSLPTTGPYYGMNYGVYMGQDAVDVMIATEAALTKIRIDKKPFLIMFNTYRYREHVGVGEDFTAGYRSRTELQFPQAQDPVEILARRLDPGVVMAIDKSIEEEIALALQFAEESPFPEPFEKLSDVYL